MKKTPPIPNRVLITGCSSGIGLATARLLRDRGWQVAASARGEEGLRRLREDGFDPVQLDLTDSASITAAAETVIKRFDGRPGALVNNAGFGFAAAVEDASRDMLRDLFEVNVFGLQELTNCFIPHFRRQGCGRIVNISSVLGEITLPFTGIYSASKYAVEALSDALRRELFDSGVAVSVVQPGPIETRFSQNLALRTERCALRPDSVFADFYREAVAVRKTGRAARTGGQFIKPPEAVAQVVFQCLESRRPPRRRCVTVVARCGAALRRFAPASFIDALMIAGLKRRLRNTG